MATKKHASDGRTPAAEARAEAAAEARAEAAGEAGDQVLELRSQLEVAHSRHLRLAADFENFRKRSRQDQLDTVQYASAALVERLLPVLDDLRLALDHTPAEVDEGWLKGIRLTLQKLEELLAGVGVEPIEAVGQAFDPKFHEAVGSEASDELPEDTVVIELRRGYRMHDRVLRPALVKLARLPD